MKQMKNSAADIFLALRETEWNILVRSMEGWDVSSVAFGPLGKAEDSVAVLARELTNLGYCGGELCLGIPSAKIFSAPVDRGDLPRGNPQKVMLYRFEEQLPIEAEQVTAVFLPAVGNQSLALAVETAPMARLLEALGSAGVEICAVVPTRWLALWDVMRDEMGEKKIVAAKYVLLREDGQVDIFGLEESRLYSWYTVPDEPEHVERCIQIDRLMYPPAVKTPVIVVFGNTSNIGDDGLYPQIGADVVQNNDVSVLSHAAESALVRQGGREAGWVDFRIQALARKKPWRRLDKLLHAAMILGAVFVITLIGVLWWRSHQYQSVAAQYRQQQADAYRKLYPGTSVPRNITRRLLSQYKLHSAVSGQATGLPETPSALDTLQKTITSLPKKVRYRITKIDVTPAGVTFRGLTRTHSDPDVLIQAFRKAGFITQPPRTERLSTNEVSFTIDLTFRAEEKP